MSNKFETMDLGIGSNPLDEGPHIPETGNTGGFDELDNDVKVKGLEEKGIGSFAAGVGAGALGGYLLRDKAGQDKSPLGAVNYYSPEEYKKIKEAQNREGQRLRLGHQNKMVISTGNKEKQFKEVSGDIKVKSAWMDAVRADNDASAASAPKIPEPTTPSVPSPSSSSTSTGGGLLRRYLGGTTNSASQELDKGIKSRPKIKEKSLKRTSAVFRMGPTFKCSFTDKIKQKGIPKSVLQATGDAIKDVKKSEIADNLLKDKIKREVARFSQGEIKQKGIMGKIRNLVTYSKKKPDINLSQWAKDDKPVLSSIKRDIESYRNSKKIFED